MAEQRDIEIQRNETFSYDFQVLNSEGDPLNVTGATFSMKVKERAGDTAVLATATVTVVDATIGHIRISLAGSALSAVPGTMEIVRLAYDLVMTLSGVPRVIMRGTLVLVPGVS
jgi:hypothetical protein